MFAPLFRLQRALTANLGAAINFFLNMASNLLTHPCPPLSGGFIRCFLEDLSAAFWRIYPPLSGGIAKVGYEA